MSYGDPDNKEIMRAIEKMQRQIDDLQRQLKESGRILSPEHIAQLSGYVLIKNDLEQIKQTIGDISGRINGRR